MESVYSQYAWLIPLFPLIAFLILTAVGKQAKSAGAYIGIGSTLASFVLAVFVFIERSGSNADNYSWSGWHWIQAGGFSLDMGFEITNLNALMLVIVSLVSLLVNIYSKGYMHGDGRMSVFFSYIALFTFSMLGLVISVNIVQLYIFWELVGVCSFLLIGFWYNRPEAKAAAKKAFIITRIGDTGLLIAILMLFWHMPGHALDFSSIHNAFTSGLIPDHTATWIALLIFVGAVGKSGQFPLHTWLPDAMEGPTPISALIHAATMVAAGVYLVARTFFIFTESSSALEVVAYIGAFTAIFAATIAVAQSDIKRVLAYSTVSQLGYMMMALGIGTTLSYAAGIFHLFTHAFFKALLFLAAGSVIHMIHKQNIHEMGGLGRTMKITAWTFGIAALSLAGVIPLSGFWSKDAILAAAYVEQPGLFWVGLIAAFFTAFYMSRLFFMVFAGKPRTEFKAKEAPAVMTVPMLILAVLAVIAGFASAPFAPWLTNWLTNGSETETIHWPVVILSNLVAVAGIFLGWAIYKKQWVRSDFISAKAPWLFELVHRKYYIDELYHYIFVRPLRGLGNLLMWFDRYVVDGLVKLSASIAIATGRAGVRLQNGQLQTYGLITVLGLLIILLAIAGGGFWNAG